jgi:hemoglobin
VSFLRTDADAYVPTAEDSPWHRLGQTEAVNALVNTFYDTMQTDEPALAAVHRQHEDGTIHSESRSRFALFLNGWLGGPQDYQAMHGHPRLRMRHAHVTIDEAMRDAWLACMQKALDRHQVSGGVRGYLNGRFLEVADFLRNV